MKNAKAKAKTQEQAPKVEPVQLTAAQAAEQLALAIAALNERSATRKPRVTFSKVEFDSLKKIVGNENYSIKAIVDVCSASPLFAGKSRGAIEHMAKAIRKKTELPHPVK